VCICVYLCASPPPILAAPSHHAHPRASVLILDSARIPRSEKVLAAMAAGAAVWEDRAGLAWLVRHWDGGQSTRLVTLVPNMQKLWCGCQYLASYRCFVDFYM
jgi:hypothetical protein